MKFQPQPKTDKRNIQQNADIINTQVTQLSYVYAKSETHFVCEKHTPDISCGIVLSMSSVKPASQAVY